MNYNQLAQLKKLRKDKGLTQGEMAEALGYRSKSGYCQLEKGVVKIDIDKLNKISEILGEEVKEIFLKSKFIGNEQ